MFPRQRDLIEVIYFCSSPLTAGHVILCRAPGPHSLLHLKAERGDVVLYWYLLLSNIICCFLPLSLLLISSPPLKPLVLVLKRFLQWRQLIEVMYFLFSPLTACHLILYEAPFLIFNMFLQQRGLNKVIYFLSWYLLLAFIICCFLPLSLLLISSPPLNPWCSSKCFCCGRS